MKTEINCPDCGTKIDVDQILATQVEKDLQQKYNLKVNDFKKNSAKQEQELQSKLEELSKQEDAFEDRLKAGLKEKEKSISEKIKKDLEAENKDKYKLLEEELSEKSKKLQEFNKAQSRIKQLMREKEEMKNEIELETQKKLSDAITKERKKLKRDFEEENEAKYESLEKELKEKSEKLKEFNKAQTKIAKLTREKEELRGEIELENEKKLSDILGNEREKIARIEADKNELKFKELQKQLEDQKTLTEEMKRKQEQGSMQLQGEVQELGIEDWLSRNFPFDSITEIKKGQRGADCIQTINDNLNQNCGTIYYESKRTKDFQPSWIEKFKTDIRDKGANIGVLVTNVLPKGYDRMALIEGVWVCTYEEFKGLCFVLRENIINLSKAISSQENKGDKMNMLYSYLTSNEFKLHIEGIVEGFTQMQSDLISEKRSIQGHWKKREKQIEKVLNNTNYMYNQIKGIAGNAVESISLLELNEPED